MTSTMYSSNSYEKSQGVTKSVLRGGNLSCRYDRVCPVVKKGQRCKQHDEFVKWCNAREHNDQKYNQQLLKQSAAMVFLTYREDTIQKQDCPFLHPKPGESSKQAVKMVTSKNAALIEAMVDYFYAAQKIVVDDHEEKKEEKEEVNINDGSGDNNSDNNIIIKNTNNNKNVAVKLERDPSSAIMGNKLVENIFEALPLDDTKKTHFRSGWVKSELTFNNTDFCTCFCSAVSIMMQINSSSSASSDSSSSSSIRSIHLQENEINTDALQNLVRAMKVCKVKDENNNNNNNNNNTTENNQHQQQTSTTATTTLASKIVLLDLSNNKIDNLTKCLFELKAYYPNLLSLFIRENPITRRPDYTELVRRTVPQIVMLDGTNLRKPPLKMPFPRISGGIEIDTSCPGNEDMQFTQRGARNFVAAYLKSLEGLSDELHVTREEFYKDDEELRDQVWHPGITASVSFVPTNVKLFDLPTDITTEEEFLARAKALEKRGGQVGAKTREKAQNIVLEKKMKEKIGENNNNNRRERTENDNDSNEPKQEIIQNGGGGMMSIPAQLNRDNHRFITKLDAKLLRGLPVSAARNCRNISDGKNSLERIGRGRLEVIDLLFGSIYPEGLTVSHHTNSASVCTVTPMCMPSVWKKLKEEEKQQKIQQRLKELNVVSKKEMKKMSKKKTKGSEDAAFNNDQDDDDNNNSGTGFGSANNSQNKQPRILMVTVHGTMSWRTPSLTGQETVTVATDQTFVVVATESEEFFKEREDEERERFEKYLEKQHRRENTTTKNNNNSNNSDHQSDDDDDSDDDDESHKTPQERRRDELLKYLKGFRICNQAVMIREINKNNDVISSSVQNTTTSSNTNNASSFVFSSPFLFNPLREGRLQRLAHLYGTTPNAVAKIMERCSNDFECEEILGNSV